jgi:hypothetical protein
MLDHVVQGFLRGPVDGRLGMLGHQAVGRLDPYLEPGKGVAEALQARGQAKVVQHRRAQPGDGRACLVERGPGQLLGPRHLLGGHLR